MTDPEAFYLPLGDGRFEPTRATESPWDQTAQHGGPPAGAVESVKPGRRVWLSQAQMTVGDRTVAVARTWHIATGPRPPIDDEHTEPPPLPEGPHEQRAFFC